MRLDVIGVEQNNSLIFANGGFQTVFVEVLVAETVVVTHLVARRQIA